MSLMTGREIGKFRKIDPKIPDALQWLYPGS
jgi:hypothetical protein